MLKKGTPVFTIVEHVAITTEKSKHNRSMILMIWGFFRALMSVRIIHGFLRCKQKWNEAEIK